MGTQFQRTLKLFVFLIIKIIFQAAFSEVEKKIKCTCYLFAYF